MKRLLLFLLLLTLAACTPTAPDPGAVQTAIAQTQAASTTETPAPTENSPICISDEFDQQLNDILTRFNDATTLADNTPRAQLATVISDLQNIRRDANNLSFPSCASEPKIPLIAYMDAIITGFTEFMSQDKYKSYFDEARANRENFQLAYDQILKQDQLATGKITPIQASSLTFATLIPQDDLYLFDLTNPNVQPVWFTTIEFQRTIADGSTEILAEQYISSLAPGETIRVGFTRTREMLERGVYYEDVRLHITESYISKP